MSTVDHCKAACAEVMPHVSISCLCLLGSNITTERVSPAQVLHFETDKASCDVQLTAQTRSPAGGRRCSHSLNRLKKQHLPQLPMTRMKAASIASCSHGMMS